MRPRQLELPTWGGRRKGAGRKPKHSPRRVSHKRRPPHGTRFPVHAILRARNDAPRLRRKDVYEEIAAALKASERADFRVTHFSVQGNHIHLMVEAADATALSRGMQGLAVRVAGGA